MPLTVFLTADAARDLEDIYQYITMHDSRGKAVQVLTNIEKVFNSLAESPERGVRPKELLALGIRDYRQVFFKPYRVIYRVSSNAVYVLLIADGRRDMQMLLQQRLLMTE